MNWTSSVRPRPAETADDDASHWLGLASSLGVAMDPTEFEESEKPSQQVPSQRTRHPAKRDRPPKKILPVTDEVEDNLFGKGLLDDMAPDPDETRQEQVPSDMFVPVGNITDAEFVDDRRPDENPEEVIEESFDFDTDDEIVEFEVEELSSNVHRNEPRRPRRQGRSRPARQTDSSEETTQRPQSAESDRAESVPGSGTGEPRRRRNRRRRSPTQSSETISIRGPDESFEAEIDEESLDRDDSKPERKSDLKSVKFPTWVEAIGPIVEGNIARHKKSKIRRPKRGR